MFNFIAEEKETTEENTAAWCPIKRSREEQGSMC